MTRICFNKSFQISVNKNIEHLTPIIRKQRLYNVKKFIKLTSNSTQNRQKTQQTQKDKKTSYRNESVENADFYKPASNKIMTTHK